MKYGGDRPAAEALADWMAARLTCGAGPDPATRLLPVPLHPIRLRERGFNQAERLARGVARRTGLEVRTDILRRVRSGASQTMLDHAARSAAVTGAFTGRAGIGERPILIVDDVWTTGATAGACRSALGAVGATGPIEILVAARTPPPIELETPREVC
jgi:predicted amidophosphoribosyltransferase